MDLSLPLTKTDFASCEGAECPSATEALLQIEGFKCLLQQKLAGKRLRMNAHGW
jgi:hypothetical protein